jgi:hypothetical protein
LEPVQSPDSEPQLDVDIAMGLGILGEHALVSETIQNCDWRLVSPHIWKSLKTDVLSVATSSRAPVAVGAPQTRANVLIGGNDDSETESQGDVGGIDFIDGSEDDESTSEVASDDMPWVDVLIPMRPSRDGGAESALVPLSDIKPRPGRRSTQVGAQRCDGLTTALHYFQALFTQDICDTFIAATNSYAAAVNRAEWQDVTASEFKVFLALVLYFGVVNLPSRRMAWSIGSIYRIPWVASTMAVKRFEAILNAWHWTDATSLSDAERRRRNKADPYWTVQGFIDALGKTFEEHYTCPQCFDIDEQCIPWKG